MNGTSMSPAEIRMSAGVTQVMVAAATGKSAGTIVKYERDRESVNYRTRAVLDGHYVKLARQARELAEGR